MKRIKGAASKGRKSVGKQKTKNVIPHKRKTIIVNLLAGPGAGKSTMAAGLFAELKWRGIECELATEYAKDLVWEKRFKTFENQVYMFGKQHHRIYRLVGEVDVVITDSPILLTPIYDGERRMELLSLVMHEYKKVPNLNFFIKRFKPYNPKGRNETEDEAKHVDGKIHSFLKTLNIPFTEAMGVREAIPTMANMVVDKLNENK